MPSADAVTDDPGLRYQAFQQTVNDNKATAILLFCDICGSTYLSSRDVVEYLRVALSHIHHAKRDLQIGRRRFVKSIGDEVMFTQIIGRSRDPAPLLKATVHHCLAFVDKMKNIGIPVKMAITLCPDVLRIDTISDQYKLPSVPNDVLGKHVNLTARMMSVASDYQLLLSKVVFDTLPRYWKTAARNGKGVRARLRLAKETRQVQIRVSKPCEFDFKGFREYIPVYALQIESPSAPTLDVSAMCFHSITLFGTEDDAEAQDARVLIEQAFPIRWPMVFMYKEGKPEGSWPEGWKPGPVSVLFRCQSYEAYWKVLEKLKEREEAGVLTTTYTVPILLGDNRPEYSDLIEAVQHKNTSWTACFLRFNNWQRSRRFKERRKDSLKLVVDCITTGVFDNFVILPTDSWEGLQTLLNQADFCSPQVAWWKVRLEKHRSWDSWVIPSTKVVE